MAGGRNVPPAHTELRQAEGTRFGEPAGSGFGSMTWLAEGVVLALWCTNGMPELPILRSVYQMIRTETGMPSLVIRLSTLHPIFASVC
jgi:hypothetical protein